MFWIDSIEKMQEALVRLSDELEEVPLLAIDLEYFNADKTQDGCIILSLIQMSTQKSDYLIDCFTMRDFIRQDTSKTSLK